MHITIAVGTKAGEYLTAHCGGRLPPTLPPCLAGYTGITIWAYGLSIPGHMGFLYLGISVYMGYLYLYGISGHIHVWAICTGNICIWAICTYMAYLGLSVYGLFVYQLSVPGHMDYLYLGISVYGLSVPIWHIWTYLYMGYLCIGYLYLAICTFCTCAGMCVCVSV